MAFLASNPQTARPCGLEFIYEYHSWFPCKFRESFIPMNDDDGTFTA